MRRGHQGLEFPISAQKLFPFITEGCNFPGEMENSEKESIPAPHSLSFLLGFRKQCLKRRGPEASVEALHLPLRQATDTRLSSLTHDRPEILRSFPQSQP